LPRYPVRLERQQYWLAAIKVSSQPVNRVLEIRRTSDQILLALSNRLIRTSLDNSYNRGRINDSRAQQDLIRSTSDFQNAFTGCELTLIAAKPVLLTFKTYWIARQGSTVFWVRTVNAQAQNELVKSTPGFE